jgi:hypothetical protein
MLAQHTNKLPNGYKILEYLKNGTEGYCQIPTTLYYKKPEDSIEIVCMFEDDNMVRVCRAGEYAKRGFLTFGRVERDGFWGYISNNGGYDWRFYPLPIQTIHTISVFGDSVYANNALVHSNTQNGDKKLFNLWGSVNINTDPITGVLRIYSCKLVIDGVEHLLLPAQRKLDGEYGMYNTTTQEFYTNTASGTLMGDNK